MTPDQPSDRPDRTALAGLLRLGILVALGLFLALAMLLAIRRLAGALQVPLSTGALLLVGGLAAAAAGGLRGAWWGGRPTAASWADGFVRFAPSLAVWTTAAAVSLRNSPAVGLVGCWALALGQEICTWRVAWGAAQRSPTDTGPACDRPRRPQHTLDEGPLPDQNDSTAEAIYQRLTRARDAAGRDLLYGSLRADLAADQRTTVVHVAFCPPFGCTPEVVVTQTAGPAAQIKLVQVLPYGARMDVRLCHVAQQAASVVFEIAVH